MGSSKVSGGVRNEMLITVTTDVLKVRLNRVYSQLHTSTDMRTSTKSLSQEGLFEYLWDLKEMALLEGKSTVELPKNWLDELEQDSLVSARKH